ncbi:hypothetical protein SAMN00017405_1372 [Desulfonispora thiosulfatigenes DSM 11270]|uniref:Uncharacterized protein n=1 Tax=Desulfonispora thiosulfatigenes DSM 11270 TaxID=656914 RepID=A0A1W1VCE5_DESTI|nr:hypothetical protein [Desulfonispora thiosulfatigenes]SMB90850.1 hypothetical protein SAMN00017405_1372 [Desulfonispora thiosulfatigenes DSM 11270]
MTIKNYFSVTMITIMFILLIILGSNLSIIRLSQITGKNIIPPFYIENMGQEKLQINIIGESYNFTLSKTNDFMVNIKIYIQNFISTVKFIMIPRLEYLLTLWIKGVQKFLSDFNGYLNILLR